MIDRTFRALTLGLLASTAIASPAWAQETQPQTTGQSPAPATNATDVTAPPPAVQKRQAGVVPDSTEIVVTAQKREENLQDVPFSIQAIGTRRLDQLNIANFEDYSKQLPSVSWNTSQSGGAVVYMRGVATGGDGNHSGSLPSVGVYLDEQPVTTVGGALDVHIYDIARIESLAGPQGTLYGASSEAGTIRIITNKPDLKSTYGRLDGELNSVDHGGQGGKVEGMINLALTPNMAFRGVAFYQKDAGYIDNVPGSRTYCGTPVDDSGGNVIGCIHNGFSVNNDAFVRKDINSSRVYGGRAALKIDLDDNWTVTPTIMHQDAKNNGFYAVDPSLGDLKIQRFRGDEFSKDRFTQAALTIEGKISNFDITYAGAYMDRPTSSILDYTDYTDAYDNAYEGQGGLANYFYYQDSAGNTVSPLQYIVGSEHFKKMSHEVRISTPQDSPIRAIVGAFYQRQTNHIYQNYKIDGLAPDLSVNGWPGTIWLTLEDREDQDWAAFGEASYDVTPKITVTAGGRLYRFDNSLFGFAGFGKNPAFGIDPDAPPNGAGASSGVRRCLTVNGEQAINDPDASLATGGLDQTPCTNVGTVEGGNAVPQHVTGSGFLYRLNAQYKPTDKLMFYATWSRGFRPGGINRQPLEPPYQPDFLVNYEAGWKTEFGPLRWNGAIYHQVWKKFQFSFLGANSLTVIHNGRDATIDGIEADVSYVAGGLTLNGAAAYTDAKTKGNICAVNTDDAQCSQTYVVTPSGTRLPITPRLKATGTARYGWSLWQGRAHVQAAVTYRGSAPVDLRQDIDGNGTNPNDYLGRLRSASLVDLFLGYDWSNYSAELFATNVFDERDEIGRFVTCSICTQARMIPGRPRTIGLRIGARF